MADPYTAEASPNVLESLGTVVVLLTSGDASEWAADAAIDLCTRWAAAGRRVVLADLHLENPVLHDRLEVRNLEGIVDIFVYGASLARIARPVREGSFFFIPAGTYAPYAGEIYNNSRWRKLVAGFQDAEATLVLFAPGDGVDLPALSAWSSDMILLGSTPSQERIDEGAALGFRVLDIVQPPGTEDAPADGVPAPVSPEDHEEFLPEALRRALEAELELPPPLRRQVPGRTRASVFLWIVLAIVVIAAIVYLFLTLRPDLMPGGSSEQPPGVQRAEALMASPPLLPRSDPLPYSVPVRAFSSLAAAREEVTSNEQRLQTVPFYISPEADQGILYYRVFAGTVPDTSAAGRLRERLIEEGMVDEDDSVGRWNFVEFTPLAFDLGEFESMAAAAERVDSLEARSIPVYATTILYSDGTRRWQLYGGAFRDSASAAAMRDMLAGIGIVTTLMARTGDFAADSLEASRE